MRFWVTVRECGEGEGFKRACVAEEVLFASCFAFRDVRSYIWELAGEQIVIIDAVLPGNATNSTSLQ
jgi:hypothetical protein